MIGKTNNGLCPITALLSYLTHHGNTPGPLFQWDNHTPLSKSKFVEHVHRALLMANIPAHLYTGHSFRIDAATIAVSAGIQDSTIQTLGRWKSSCISDSTPLVRPIYLLPWLIAPYEIHIRILSSVLYPSIVKSIMYIYQYT